MPATYVAQAYNRDDDPIDPNRVIASITSDGAIHVMRCHEQTHDVWVKSLRDESGQRIAVVVATPLPADAVGLIRILSYDFLTAPFGRKLARE